MKIIGIIPARYNSSRLPGKPLADINGKTMIRRVYEQASKVIENVIVATDDKRITDEVSAFGGISVMTSESHQSGTDRCAEAIEIYENISGNKFDIVINIQGDEPFIHESQLKLLISCFDHENTQIATLIKKIDNKEDIFDINKPKVIINKDKEAIYFSRSTIPFVRNYEQKDWISKHVFYKHLGIYGYKKEILKKITLLEQSSLEKAESLEQNRWIENNYKIKTEITDIESFSVDTFEDLEKIKII